MMDERSSGLHRCCHSLTCSSEVLTLSLQSSLMSEQIRMFSLLKVVLFTGFENSLNEKIARWCQVRLLKWTRWRKRSSNTISEKWIIIHADSTMNRQPNSRCVNLHKPTNPHLSISTLNRAVFPSQPSTVHLGQLPPLRRQRLQNRSKPAF